MYCAQDLLPEAMGPVPRRTCLASMLAAAAPNLGDPSEIFLLAPAAHHRDCPRGVLSVVFVVRGVPDTLKQAGEGAFRNGTPQGGVYYKRIRHGGFGVPGRTPWAPGEKRGDFLEFQGVLNGPRESFAIFEYDLLSIPRVPRRNFSPRKGQ